MATPIAIKIMGERDKRRMVKIRFILSPQSAMYERLANRFDQRSMIFPGPRR